MTEKTRTDDQLSILTGALFHYQELIRKEFGEMSAADQAANVSVAAKLLLQAHQMREEYMDAISWLA